MNDRVIYPTLLLVALLFTGCRSMYYSAWESVGKHKRDLLKDRVEEAREGQVAAAQQFTNALTRLKDLYRFDGGASARRITIAEYPPRNRRRG